MSLFSGHAVIRPYRVRSRFFKKMSKKSGYLSFPAAALAKDSRVPALCRLRLSRLKALAFCCCFLAYLAVLKLYIELDRHLMTLVEN